ncbi:MAG: endonuclease/exonuclease/phosphatase family protein [Verrucomicrobia bacterium]|nr:endonuclease/exonuclease/phosphatase family protein [Verrucomicrobiota bacterium]
MNISIKLFLLLVSLWMPSLLLAKVEESITPLLDHYHAIANIETKKYSKNQHKAITDALSHKGSIIRVVSYQMLFNRYDEILPSHLRWKERLPRIVQLLKEMNADIICSQQLYPKQVTDLLEQVGKEYEFIGNLPEEEEKDPDEVHGVFYRKSRFTCKEAQACTIRDAEEILGPEAQTFTEVHLFDKITGKEFAVLSVHAPFGSPDAREYMARFLVGHVEPICEQKACLVAGDFNTFMPRVDDSFLPYYDGNYILKILTSKNLRNSRDTALIGTLGPLATYTNKEGSLLPFQGKGTPGVFLDHIFAGGNMIVLLHAVQPALVDGFFASDHMPVIADCVNLH